MNNPEQKTDENQENYNAVLNLGKRKPREVIDFTAITQNISRKVKKTTATLSQSIALHALVLSTWAGAVAISDNRNSDSKIEQGITDTTKGLNSDIENQIKEQKLKKLIEQYPDLDKIPQQEQEALLILLERNIKEIERRKKLREERTSPEQIQKFKSTLRKALENDQEVSFKEFFHEHEWTFLGVDEEELMDGWVTLDGYIEWLKDHKNKLTTAALLQKIAGVTSTEADYDKNIERDMTNVSLYQYVNTRESKEEVIGSCQAKAKAAIVLLEKVYPELKDKIYYIEEAGHIHAAIEINGQLYAINNGRAYKMSNEQRYGTAIYSPYRSIGRFADAELPEATRCELKPGQKCLLNPQEARKGHKLEITHPPDYEGGLNLPFIAENDGIRETESNLLAKTRDPRQMFPDLDKEHRKLAREKVKKDSGPTFYSPSLKTHYLNVAEKAEEWGEKLPDEAIKAIVPAKSGQLTLDFGDADTYEAETLQKILDAKTGIQRDIIFDGITEDVLRAIAHSQINGNVTFTFKTKEDVEEGVENIPKLLKLPNAPNFNIRLACYKGAIPGEKITQTVLDLLEKHPVKIEIISAAPVSLSPQIHERIRKINEDSEMKLHSYDADHTLYRIIAPHFSISAGKRRPSYGEENFVNQQIGRADGVIVPDLNYINVQEHIFSRYVIKEKSPDVVVRYSTADRLGIRNLPLVQGSRLLLDTDYISPSEAGHLVNFGLDSLILDGITQLDAQTARALAQFRGHLQLDGVTQIDETAVPALTKFGCKTLGLNGLSQLSPDIAAALANSDIEQINLDGLTSLTPEVAEILSKYKRQLSLRGLTQFDDKTAQAFYNTKAHTLYLDGLSQPDEKLNTIITNFAGNTLGLSGFIQLDPGTANAISQSRANEIRLDGLTSLDAETAKILAKFGGSVFSFGILRHLDPNTAKALAKFKGKTLALDGLLKPTPATAAALAEFQGEQLSLNTIPRLDPNSAASLANFTGDILSLNGLIDLDAKTAKALAKFDGKLIQLHSLKHINEETAMALAKFKGIFNLYELSQLHPELVGKLEDFHNTNEWLDLGSLTKLDEKTAVEIAKYKGKEIRLNSLTRLTPKVARALAQFKGTDIILIRLTHIDRKTALEFAKFKGSLWLPSLTTVEPELLKKFGALAERNLGLNGLKNISPEIATIIKNMHGGNELGLDGLTQLDTKTADILASFGKALYLNGLTDLSLGTVKALAKSNGILFLRGIKQLDLQTTQALADSNCRGILLGISELNVEQAKAWATFKGNELNLPYLTQISPAVAHELSKFEGKIHPGPLSQMIQEKAEQR